MALFPQVIPVYTSWCGMINNSSLLTPQNVLVWMIDYVVTGYTAKLKDNYKIKEEIIYVCSDVKIVNRKLN